MSAWPSGRGGWSLMTPRSWVQPPVHSFHFFCYFFHFYFIYFRPIYFAFHSIFYPTYIYYSENISNIDPYYFCLYYLFMLCFMSFEHFSLTYEVLNLVANEVYGCHDIGLIRVAWTFYVSNLPMNDQKIHSWYFEAWIGCPYFKQLGSFDL